MKNTKALYLLLSFIAFGISIKASQANDKWFAGSWDSTIYNRSEKPRTVAIRVEVLDVESGSTIQGARVRLVGNYLAERIGTAGDEVGVPYEPQEKEFSIETSTGDRGVAVFALSWQKEYPWEFGQPKPKARLGGSVETGDVHTSRTRAVDDVEKVRGIEVRHPRYRLVTEELTFAQLLEFGQDKRSETQEPDIIERFAAAWHREIRRPNVKFCVLDLGVRFTDFGNKNCRSPDFFQRVASKEFGTVYTDPPNWFSVGEFPQSACGPYLVYLITIQMQILSGSRQAEETRSTNNGDETFPSQNRIDNGGRVREN